MDWYSVKRFFIQFTKEPNKLSNTLNIGIRAHFIVSIFYVSVMCEFAGRYIINDGTCSCWNENLINMKSMANKTFQIWPGVVAVVNHRSQPVSLAGWRVSCAPPKYSLSVVLMVVESRACDLNPDTVWAYTISKFGIHSLYQTRIFQYIPRYTIKLWTYRRQHTSVQLAWKMDVWKSIIL